MDLVDIRTDLTVRNFIAYSQDARYHVNMVRTNHEQRVVMVTRNGKVLTEQVFNGPERKPALDKVFELRKLFSCEGFENENV